MPRRKPLAESARHGTVAPEVEGKGGRGEEGGKCKGPPQ